jgi:cytidine deaminase
MLCDTTACVRPYTVAHCASMSASAAKTGTQNVLHVLCIQHRLQIFVINCEMCRAIIRKYAGRSSSVAVGVGVKGEVRGRDMKAYGEVEI